MIDQTIHQQMLDIQSKRNQRLQHVLDACVDSGVPVEPEIDDLFGSLIDPIYRAGNDATITAQIVASKEWADLRAQAKFDPRYAGNALIPVITEILRQEAEAQSQGDSLFNDDDTEGDDQGQDEGQGQGQGQGEGQDEGQDQGQSQGQGQGQGQGQNEGNGTGNGQPVNMTNIKSVIRRATKELAALQSAERVFGIGGHGAGSQSVQHAEQLAAQMPDLTGHTRRIIELAGRMVATNRIKPRKSTTQDHGEKSTLDIGSRLTDALPSELAMLVNDNTKLLTLRKVAEASLTQWQREDDDNMAEGPIIFLVDKSASMEGQRLVYAKALLLTLLSEARAQKRDFAVVWFDWGVDQTFLFNKASTPSQIIQAMNVWANGGTDFDSPLRYAVDAYLQGDKRFSKSDIILLTDGEASTPGRWFEKARDRLKFNLTGIGLETCGHSLGFCDTTLPIYDLTPESTIEALKAVR